MTERPGTKGIPCHPGVAQPYRLCRATLAIAALMAAMVALGPPASAQALPDDRGWEMVSPVEKNGGGISSPADAGEGTFGAAAQGGAIAYASRSSFAGGAGAAPFSQYLSSRGSEWGTQNITPAHLADAYEGAPYLAFSADLSRSLLLNPKRCPAGDPCPEGFKLRDNGTGATVASLEDPGEFETASADLRHIVLRRGADFYLWSPPVGPMKLTVPLADSPAAPEGGTFFVDSGHLYRHYAGGSTTDLTPGGGVDTFLGADAGGSTAYYRVDNAIWRWRDGTATQILTAFPSNALDDTSTLTSGVTADGNRLFFTTAARFPLADVNLAPDVYQWQVQGSGSCARAGGCVELISAGLAGTSTFVGASADGADVFFTTDRSLVSADPGSVDLYDARVGGGFPEPQDPPLCVGDACQSLPPAVEDPVLTTTLQGPPNPRERYHTYCPAGKRLKVFRGRGGKRVKRCVAAKKRPKGKQGAKKRRGGRR